MKKFIVLITSVCMALALTGCNDGGSGIRYYESVATVENPNGSSAFFFTTDSGFRMWAGATDIPWYRPKDGQRIIVDYAIINEKEAGSAYDYDVRIYDVYEILTKDAVEITPGNSGQYGNDPVYMRRIWAGGGYINFSFIFAGHHETHFINLGLNTSQEYNDGKVHLEFRHNAYNDPAVVDMWGIVSFDPTTVLDEDFTEPVDIVIHYRDFYSGNRTYELKYSTGGGEDVDGLSTGLPMGEMR